MKNICLINPPSPFLINERVFVSLGILRVAASLELHDYPVTVLDLSGISDWKYELDKNIMHYDIVGISSTTPQIPIVSSISLYIRQNFHKKVILGGPHATLINSAYKREIKFQAVSRATAEMERLKACFDIIVSGDGELAVLRAIEDNQAGIIDSEQDDSLFLTDEMYNALPLPARHLINIESYSYKIDGLKSTNLIGQMGCPFACRFCGGRHSKTFRKIRKRTVDAVMLEIDLLYKSYGYKGFMFYDDELNVNKHLFNHLLDSLIHYQKVNDVRFKLRGFTRVDLLTREQAYKMYEAGFRWMLTGFESGSDRMLNNMNKKNTVNDNTRAIEMAKRASLKVKALMSIGHPGESMESINETRQWVQMVRPDEVDITIISTYPGTPYYDESQWNPRKGAWEYASKKTGDKLYSLDVNYMEDSVFYKTDPANYKSFVFTDHMSCDDLVSERIKLESILAN